MRLLTLGFWLVLPVLSLLVIVLGLATMAAKVDNKPAGIPGTYTVVSRSCAGGLCLPSGTFTSADGTFVREGLAGDSGWRTGTTHGAVFDPSATAAILPLPGRWDPTAQICAITGGVGLLLVWGWALRGAHRRVPGAHPGPHLSVDTGVPEVRPRLA